MLARLRSLWRNLLRRSNAEHDMDEEMAFHLDARVADLESRGLASAEARRQARIEFGGVEKYQQAVRENRRVLWAEDLVQDLRFAFRGLRRNFGFSAIVVSTLGLGIGANTAMFSVIDGVLLRPLPYPNSQELVQSRLADASGPSGASSYGTADFVAASENQQTLSHFAAYALGQNAFTYTGGSEPLRLRGMAVTSDFFVALGIAPFLGRTFSAASGHPGSPREVVLSYRLWQSRFGGDPRVIGRPMLLDGDTYAVVAVMPDRFQFGPNDNNEIWPVLQLDSQNTRRPPFWLGTLARLKPGITEAQAAADLSRVAAHEQKLFPSSTYDRVSLVRWKAVVVGDSRLALVTLQAAVMLVLLIAIVNVANLQIARASGRERELAIRSSLGAGRARLIRQMLAESVSLAGVGGGVGVLLATWGVRAVLRLAPESLPRMAEIAVNGRVLLVATVLSLSSGILFGIAPALRGFGPTAGHDLRSSGIRAGQPRTRGRLLSALVVAEFSLSVMLLAGAGLLIRSFDQLLAATPGFLPEHLITGQLALPKAQYSSETQIADFYRELLARIEAIPGVQAAAVSMALPPNLLAMENPFRTQNEPFVPGQSLHVAEELTISPGYFRTLGVRLVAGRSFEEQDRLRRKEIVIVNETLAKLYFPSQDAIGRRLQTGDADPQGSGETIVGVVGDVKYQGLDAKPEPTLYVPYFEEGWTSWSREMFLLVRTTGNEAALVPSIREALWSIDRELPLASVRTMDALLTESVGTPRFRTALLGLFALLSLVLAAAGIYGVISYSVEQRTSEFGIRMALGASRQDIFRSVLAFSGKLTLLGLVIGVPASLALAGMMEGLLFQVKASDPLTYIGVALLLLLVGILAGCLPALRATHVEPIAALRYE